MSGFVRLACQVLHCGLAALVTLSVSTALAGPDGEPRADWPGGARADLVVPEEIWEEALRHVGYADRPLGYSEHEMAHYGSDAHVLRTVRLLFKDVRAIPRYTGKAAEDLLAAAHDPAAVAQLAFRFIDTPTGRMLRLPDWPAWGVPWIAEDASPGAALDAVLAFMDESRDLPGPGHIDDADRAAWEALPDPVQRLVVRLFVAAAEAGPWVRSAYDEPFLLRATGVESVTDIDRDALYELAIAPWVDVKHGQLASLRSESFEALERIDLARLGYGSVMYFTHVRLALDEFAAWEKREDLPSMDLPGLRFDTALGRVQIFGTGNDIIDEPAFLTIDLGGDDTYIGRHGVPLSLVSPIAVVVDLGGDDHYKSDEPAALACGLFGIGAILDLAGNDRYESVESGLGCAWYGVGLLMDFEGDDYYSTRGKWGQAAAHAGVALLIDLSGDDTYICDTQSQGMGSTLGAGVLVDVKGNDRYIARDDGNISELYLGQSVAMSQGVGYGRRADMGDGRSLAGGVGALIDGEGDDHYHAQVWAQGAAYWWGLGFLEDLGGNDTYRNGKYSSGAAAHFGIGVHVDLSGDDRYNIGNDTAKNQFQGHARDGSIGIFIDGDGDDQYEFRTHCAGSGDLGSIGLFWDRRGDDVYTVIVDPEALAAGWARTLPLGSATVYETPFRSFRDDLSAVGIFLDTGGEDRYIGPTPAANDSIWMQNTGPRSFGYGRDVEWYPRAKKTGLP